MSIRIKSKLNPRKRYLQIALNSTLRDAHDIIRRLPKSDRIIVEAGTPLIKRYGMDAIRQIRGWLSGSFSLEEFGELIENAPVATQYSDEPENNEQRSFIGSYIVADMKTMDRGGTEVEMVASAGASAAIALGNAPIETLNSFIEECNRRGLDAMVDMMNVDYPLAVLRQLKRLPQVVILHRGVDEEQFNKEKQIPYHEIQRIKGNYDIMVSIAGGDTLREVQRSIFNDADIVIVWKSVYKSSGDTAQLVSEFLKTMR